jgi:hypothetical protein
MATLLPNFTPMPSYSMSRKERMAVRALINTRFAYVAFSRASEDAQIYTDNTATLGRRLSSDLSKTAAIKTSHNVEPTARERVVSAFRQHDPRAARSAIQPAPAISWNANVTISPPSNGRFTWVERSSMIATRA